MKTLSHVYGMRAQDIYPAQVSRENLMNTFYPEDLTELVQGLSNVTAAFYGFLLEKASRHFGFDSVDLLSKELFYELGRLKTAQALQKTNNLPKDTRAIAIVLISAIFSASPEYNFTIKAFSSQHTIIELTGIDRYYRICTALNIDESLTWPVLTPFMQAINDELQLNCDINIHLEKLDNNGETKCTYEFIKNN